MVKNVYFEIYKKQFIKMVNDDKNKHLYKGGRPRKISIDYYLDVIYFVITNGGCWKKLDLLPDIKIRGDSIRKQFVRWRPYFNKLNATISEYYKVKTAHLTDTFIDSTDVINSNGLKRFAKYGQKFKGKRATRIHTIVDSNQIILSCVITPASINDGKITPILINRLIKIYKPTYHNPIYVVGDKGYINNGLKIQFKKRNIILVYPYRKNQKMSNTYKNKKKLNKRHIVENTYSKLKRGYKRINNLCDRDIKNYKTTIEIANSINIIEKLLKN